MVEHAAVDRGVVDSYSGSWNLSFHVRPANNHVNKSCFYLFSVSYWLLSQDWSNRGESEILVRKLPPEVLGKHSEHDSTAFPAIYLTKSLWCFGMEEKMKKIAFYEPWFFLFFGVFHLHRIWGLVDRESYADFWLRILENKNGFYYILIIVLSALCILGSISFFKNIHHNYWWRWIYIVGGSYLLFDLFAICVGLKFWNKLLLWMYDTASPYWNLIWLMFIVLGGFSFGLGVKLMRENKKSIWRKTFW